jgi:hypothetical protein
MSFLRWCASNIFTERISGADNNCEVKSRVFQSAGGIGAELAIAAVTGKRLRVLSLLAWSDGAAVYATVGTGAAGATGVMSYRVPISTAATPNVILPFAPCGWGESTTSNALYVSTSAAVATLHSFVYIEFTP